MTFCKTINLHNLAIFDFFSSESKIGIILALVLLFVILCALLLKNWRALILAKHPLRPSSLALFLLLLLIPVTLIFPPLSNTLRLMITDQSGISQTIIFVTIVGVMINISQYLSLNREYQGFISLETLFDGITGSPSWVEIEDLMDRKSKGLMREKWLNLKKTLIYAEQSDYETLIAFPDQREFLRESKPSFIIKVLPILGLIGTVSGFVMAILGMQAAAAGMADFSSFKTDMLGALGGMKTAFLTTLAGMSGLLLMLFLNSLLLEARRRIILNENELLYLKVYLPRLKKAQTEESDEVSQPNS